MHLSFLKLRFFFHTVLVSALTEHWARTRILNQVSRTEFAFICATFLYSFRLCNVLFFAEQLRKYLNVIEIILRARIVFKICTLSAHITLRQRHEWNCLD